MSQKDWSRAASGWRRWHRRFALQSAALTRLITEESRLAKGMKVLDLASGSGEPALTAARIVGQRGHVTATDISPEMLAVAEENAIGLGLRNMTFCHADSRQLPFQDEEFDAVTCRLGLMFFPDVRIALRETRRVLKRGGRVSFLTWGPQTENPRFASTFGVLLNDRKLSAKIPQPELFRYDNPESISEPLKQAGFRYVRAAYHSVPFPWNGPPEEAFECFRELSAPFQRTFARVPVEDRERITTDILNSFRRYYDGDSVAFTAKVVLASGSS